MRDAIEIHDVRVKAVIGVDKRERRVPQEIVISLRLETDTRRPGRSDRLKDAIDYRAVTTRVAELAESSKYFLIERLAEEIAHVCLEEFHLPRVRVRVEKPGALRRARAAAVTIERDASDYRKDRKK